ncbi:MAG TPA: ATP-binding protein, partial [Candidatus Aenigmarchaeota archaeon]|nr:ATP-binding protein [Candidatus Aenigmarchaeota archaeon]
MEFEFLAKHNPWWKVKEAIVGDSKVSYAINKKKSYIPHLITKFKGNYSIRGPRQVGKTTALKLFIWECIIKLGVDPKKILYLPCDTLKDFREIVQAVELHREWLAELDIEENYVLFDEITFVSEWYKGIKYIIDQQLCTLLVFTGSLASDLKSGVERFPGRAVKNIFYLPLKFSEYVKLFGSNELRGTLNKIKLNTLLEDIEKGASILLPFLPELNRLLEKYLITGGFLKPSFQFHENKRIEEETYVDYVNWILGDLSKIEKSELFFREVINAIIKKYGTSLSYHSIAKKT